MHGQPRSRTTPTHHLRTVPGICTEPLSPQIAESQNASHDSVQKGVSLMKSGQQSGTGAMTELNDEKVRKNDILSNREKAQRLPDQQLDRTGVRVEEYKDIPTNQRPKKTPAKPDEPASDEESDEEKIDRPGFDLGGTNHDTAAGKGLGLGKDAMVGRKDWALRK